MELKRRSMFDKIMLLNISTSVLMNEALRENKTELALKLSEAVEKILEAADLADGKPE